MASRSQRRRHARMAIETAGARSLTSLPPGALGWSLAAFNVGVELGQLAAVALALGLLAAVRRYDVVLVERIAVVGSVGVIVAGGYWFAERVGIIA